MKRLTYFYLILVFVAANALLFVGCGCDDDDDDGDDTADSGAGTAGERTTDTGVGGTSGSGGEEGEDAGEQTEDTGVSGDDAAVDAETEPDYACGGDDAECDLLNNEGCDEGDGCQFLAPSSGEGAPFAQCVEAGDGEAGDACDSDNPCSAGYDCNDGFCYKYCCTPGSSDECPEDQACIIDILDKNDESTGVLLCDECDECNPLTADGCGEGQGCYPIPSPSDDTDIGCRLCLASVGDKEAGESCDSANECQPGIGCYSINDAEAVCTSFCDLEADPDPCAPDGTCTGDLIGLASMNDTVGLCVPNEE